MTREEAITILKDISWQMGSVKRWENIEAIDMAIEALSAEVQAKCIAEIKVDAEDIYTRITGLVADKVDVVRCKNCIHWKADNEVFELGFCCVFPQKWVAETFYCADGERREE